MKADDPRLASIDLRQTFGVDPEGAWPRAGEVTAIMATADRAVRRPGRPLDSRDRAAPGALSESESDDLRPVRRPQPARRPAGRAGAKPLGFRDSIGRCRDLGERRPAEGQGLRPRARRAARYRPLARHHRRRSRRPRAAVARGRRRRHPVGQGAGRRRRRPRSRRVRVPAAPPPEVVFSAPTQDESDVPLAASVRIQFSRDIAPATLKGHVRASYLESETSERGEPMTPTAEFTTQYTGANRVARTEVHQAARTLPDAAGRVAGRHSRDRSAAAQALDAELRRRRILSGFEARLRRQRIRPARRSGLRASAPTVAMRSQVGAAFSRRTHGTTRNPSSVRFPDPPDSAISIT